MAVGHVHRSIKNTQDSSNVDRSAPAIDRAAPAIYGDLHNCVGWPPSERLHAHGPDLEHTSQLAVCGLWLLGMLHDALYVSRAQRALFPLRGESVVQTVLKNG